MCKNRNFVKLIDFGFANFCRQSSVSSSDHHLSLTETKGTPCYMSPEVLKGKYDKRCDLWSIGVITYYLLAGKLPFRASTEERLNTLIMTTDYDFEERDWTELSILSKQFIRGLIDPNVKTRMTCEQALAHPWIQNNKPHLTDEQKTDIAEIFMRLKNFKGLNRFQMALMLIFRRHISQDRVVKNLLAFHAIDTENSG
jgi:calcium-dependent protein kinase